MIFMHTVQVSSALSCLSTAIPPKLPGSAPSTSSLRQQRSLVRRLSNRRHGEEETRRRGDVTAKGVQVNGMSSQSPITNPQSAIRNPKFTLHSFAKINWSLEILGRRPDGYHEVRTLLQTITLHDE